MTNSHLRRLLVASGLLLGVGIVALLAWGAWGPVTRIHDFIQVENWMPSLTEGPTDIKVVARRTEIGPEEVSQEQLDGPAEFSIKHLGRLEGKDLAFMKTMLLKLGRSRKRRLAKFTKTHVDVTKSEDLLREAELILADTEAACLVPALEANLYVVEKTPTIRQVDGANVVNSGCQKDGKSCVLTLVMPHSKFPRLKDTWDYWQEMRVYHAAEVSRKFNSLTHEERRFAVARREAIMKDPNSSPSDRKWMYKQFPARTRIDQRTFLMTARPIE